MGDVPGAAIARACYSRAGNEVNITVVSHKGIPVFDHNGRDDRNGRNGRAPPAAAHDETQGVADDISCRYRPAYKPGFAYNCREYRPASRVLLKIQES